MTYWFCFSFIVFVHEASVEVLCKTWQLGAFTYDIEHVFFQTMTRKELPPQKPADVAPQEPADVAPQEPADMAPQVGEKRQLSPESQEATCKLSEYFKACI